MKAGDRAVACRRREPLLERDEGLEGGATGSLWWSGFAGSADDLGGVDEAEGDEKPRPGW